LIQENRNIVETLDDSYVKLITSEWEDFDDFNRKYGIANNPTDAKERLAIWRSNHFIGMMMRDGLIDVKTYVNYIGDSPMQIWDKYKDIIKEFRNEFAFPEYMAGMEYLSKEIEKYREEQGWETKPTFGSSVVYKDR
jgi:hypothetical protein